MHSHPTDWVYHAIMTEMCPDICKDPEKNEWAWDLHRKIYQTQDYLLGKILELVGRDTLIVTISDHGAVPDGPYVNPVKILAAAGLLTLKGENAGWGKAQNPKFEHYKEMLGLDADPAQSRAMPQRSCYVYVNLKGRDPQGIVEPEDYEKVQYAIIDALMAYVHPETGERPFALALTRKDARLLGLGGEQCGDVVYALRPRYCSQHGAILPTAEYSIGCLKALLTFTGPGVKKGARMERFCNIIDMVPTVCHLMGLPVPGQCEGAILYQLLEDF